MIMLLVDSALRSLILGCAIGLGLTLFRVRHLGVLSLVWTVAMIASLAMPLRCEGARDAAPRWAAVGLPAGAPAWLDLAGMSLTGPASADSIQHLPAMAAAGIGWADLAPWIYAPVAIFMLARLFAGLALTWRLARRAKPFPVDRRRNGDVRISPEVTVPMTFGGTILLPAEAIGWSAEKLGAVLAHERAHVARGDFRIHLLARLNRAVFWFSPFPWWLANQLAELAEAASDDAAIAPGGAIFYAETLLDIAARAHRVPAGVAMARSGSVGPRIERILAGATSHPLRRRTGALITLCLVPAIALAAADVAAPALDAAPKQIVIDPTILDRYVGSYEFDPTKAPDLVVNITRDGDHLFSEAYGMPRVEIFPQSERVFFEKGVDVKLAFVADGAAPATGLHLIQGGHLPGFEGKRVDAAEAQRARAAIDRKRGESARPHTAITVDPKIFDNYVGMYQYGPLLMSVTRQADYLFVQVGASPKIRVLPETDHDFFYQIINAQISFVTDSSGKATRAIFRQDGRDMPALRIDDAAAKQAQADLAKRVADETRPRVAVAIDPKLLDNFTGHYQASASNAFTVTRQGDGLFVQYTGQPAIEVYPENDHEFFYTVVPAQITFIADQSGRATQLVLHQGGQDVVAPRTD